MSRRRTDLPVALHGATEWSGSPLQTPDGLLDFLKANKPVKRKLIALADPPAIEGGRPRLPGQWSLAYLLYLLSGEATIKRWLQKTDSRIWRRCCFVKRPKYDTVHHHFARLEEHADAFRRVAIDLIHLAVDKSDGLVGRDIHVDGTEAESNTRAFHDCPPGTCPRGKGPGRSPIAKTPTPTVQQVRQSQAAGVPSESDPEIVRVQIDPLRNVKRVQYKNGCWYRFSDETAGARSLRGPGGQVKRFWVGFNNLKVVDHYTGAVLATMMIPADINESKAYPALLNQLLENTGELPRGVAGDRGFSLNEVYELNTKAGILTATPWRKHKPGEDRDTVGTDYYDQHGVPLCQKCGGPGRQTRFQAGDNPRIWFQCENGCGEGSVVCSRGPRYLLPVPRTSETYLALRRSHSHYEKAHWRWRDQFLVGPDNPSNRPRRRGIACQELRAQAALLIEWLIVCYREGWLGGKRRNPNKSFTNRAKKQLRRLKLSRVSKGLHLPKDQRQAHLDEILKKKQARAE